ncbi:unnamed protein product [Eruca vesicaria subsp. sativa]|uniref:Uncharacterized protein n=1 Tax=Eruca vesicaria subsp. sativa TaxID=29727 RepID=A0ABC8KHE4_ERUVS|nr:unnamed protein product [Eruca vesicaria subsp. sativa]
MESEIEASQITSPLEIPCTVSDAAVISPPLPLSCMSSLALMDSSNGSQVVVNSLSVSSPTAQLENQEMKASDINNTMPSEIPPQETDAHDLPSGPSDDLEVCSRNPTMLTKSFSSPSLQENPADPLNSVTTFSTLVDSQSTPIDTSIMEFSSSNIINNEVLESLVFDPVTTTPNQCAFESPSRFRVLGDVDEAENETSSDVDEAENETSSSFSLTRGGRESKPLIKYQNMEWQTARGRGKRGRGRGSYH